MSCHIMRLRRSWPAAAAIRRMQVHRHPSPASFLERAERWLMRAELENNFILGTCLGLRARVTPFDPSGYLATVEDSGQVVACALRLPSDKLILTRADPAALGCLVHHLADTYSTLPGVFGPEPDAGQFAQLWSRRVGSVVRPAMEERLFEIRRVLPFTGRPPGELRPALETDLEIVGPWVSSFSNEVGDLLSTIDPFQLAREVVGQRRLFVWQDAEPVTMAGWAGRTPNGARVNLVYTPPQFRRRGYASACVAELTTRLLAEGRSYCCLFADVANRTSNSIYQKMGYRPVCTMRDYVLNDQTRGVPRLE